MFMNKVILCGVVSSDVELRQTNDGVPVTNFTLKTVDYWKNKNTGEKQSNAKFHKIVCWGNIAKTATYFLTKNSTVLVEGELSYHKVYKEGEKPIHNTEIKATKIAPYREQKNYNRQGGNK